MAGPAGFTQLPNYDLGEMSRYFDWVNIMAYDFHGGWETRTNHQAPLFLNPGDPEDPVSREKLNTAWAVLAYLQAGVPPEKIGLGVPFYGRAWEGVPSTDNGLFMPGPSLPPPSGPGIWEAGVIDYWKIQDLLAGLLGYNRHWDDYAKVPFVYGPNITPGKTSGGMFITYEDQTSVRGKIQYLREKGLGGIMFWDLSGDIKDSSVPNSLLHIIYQEMNRAYDVSGAQILLLQ
jgi:chitinase